MARIYYVTHPWWVRWVTRPVEAIYRAVNKWAEKHARYIPVKEDQ